MKQNIKIDFLVENIKLGLGSVRRDCHKNVVIIYGVLKKKGYDVKRYYGVYVNLPKTIRHSWIETKDLILETDCRQLREEGDIMPEEFCSCLPKKKFRHRYIKKNLNWNGKRLTFEDYYTKSQLRELKKLLLRAKE